MRLSTLLPFVLAILRVDALTTSIPLSSNARTTLYCKTSLGTRVVSPVPTSTQVAVTFSRTAIRRTTVTPLVIVTPPPSTKTVTVATTVSTTTTLAQQTDVYTFTSTSTVVQNKTTTLTLYSTYLVNITTTTTATTTVPTAAGFTPLAQQLRRSGFHAVAASRNETTAPAPQLSARAIIPQRHKRASSPHSKSKVKSKSPSHWPFGHKLRPTRVECAAIIRVTATSTRVLQANVTATATIAPSVVTTTALRTVTATVQSKPSDAVSATTTVFTSTRTQTYTSTITQTTTKTNVIAIAAPTQTKYAVCSPENIVNSINGKYIRGFTGDNNSFGGHYNLVTLPGITSAENCCIQCSQAPKGQCDSFVWSAPYNTCYLVYPDSETCAPKKTIGFLLTGSGSPNEQVSVGNSNCGKVKYDGR